MAYKIGFFIDLSCEKVGFPRRNNVLLHFKDDHFAVRLVDKTLIPESVSIKDVHCYEPVLFEEVNSIVTKVIPLNDIPLSVERYRDKGYEITCPYYKLQKTSNPALRNVRLPISYRYNGYRNKTTYFDVEIRHNGHSLIYCPDIIGVSYVPPYWSRNNNRKKEYLLYFYTIIQNAIERICKEENNHRRCKIEEIVNQITHYVDSIDIDDILKSLSIEIKEHYRYKAGDDDSCFVWKTVTVDNECANNDIYLKKLIELGDTTIDRWRGIGSCPIHVKTGFLNNNELEEEKDRIRSLYSKEKHTGMLVYEAVLMRRAKEEKYVFHNNNKYALERILYDKYHLDRAIDGGTYYFLMNHCKGLGVDEMISKVNQFLEEKTKCSFSEEEMLHPPFTELTIADSFFMLR